MFAVEAVLERLVVVGLVVLDLLMTERSFLGLIELVSMFLKLQSEISGKFKAFWFT